MRMEFPGPVAPAAARRPEAPVILFRDDQMEPPPDQNYIPIPDAKTYRMRDTEVTFYFEDPDAYTAEPFVADVPRVCWLGRTDDAARRFLYEAFYLYGRQLERNDLDRLLAGELSLQRLIDELIREETSGRETVFSRVWDRQQECRRLGFAFLPWLDGAGVHAKLGKHARQVFFDPVPVYPGPPPPAYDDLFVEVKARDVVGEEEEEEAVPLEAPPCYEDVVASSKPSTSPVVPCAAPTATVAACTGDRSFAEALELMSNSEFAELLRNGWRTSRGWSSDVELLTPLPGEEEEEEAVLSRNLQLLRSRSGCRRFDVELATPKPEEEEEEEEEEVSVPPTRIRVSRTSPQNPRPSRIPRLAKVVPPPAKAPSPPAKAPVRPAKAPVRPTKAPVRPTKAPRGKAPRTAAKRPAFRV
ncbi:hypothetical protein GGR56DRAFT_690615 [Xylariaceae sp. FL0804]|nr:hypothetical protein GGR56DRAFT_690615 [Xylariaceae sp. FL0804]